MEGKKNQKPESKSSSDSDLAQQNQQQSPQQKRPFPPFKFDEEGWEKEKQKMSEAQLRMVEAFNL